MSLSSEQVDQLVAQLERIKADFVRSLNTMQAGLLDGLPPSDEAAFLRSVEIMQKTTDVISSAMDKVAIIRMEDQF